MLQNNKTELSFNFLISNFAFFFSFLFIIKPQESPVALKRDMDEASADSTVIILDSSDDEEISDYEENLNKLVNGDATEPKNGALTPMNQSGERNEEPTLKNSNENNPNGINESKKAATIPIRLVEPIPMELNDDTMDSMPHDEYRTDEVNEEKQYRCEVCASRFTRKNTLTTHLHAVHNINY